MELENKENNSVAPPKCSACVCDAFAKSVFLYCSSTFLGKVSCRFSASPLGPFGNHTVIQVGRILWPNRICHYCKDDKASRRCLQHRHEENDGEFLEKDNHRKKHDGRGAKSCDRGGQDGRSHGKQGVFGSSTPIAFTHGVRIGVCQMNNKVTVVDGKETKTSQLFAGIQQHETKFLRDKS
jgi:hypothetical protein